MKTFTLNLLLFCVVLFTFASCNKDKNTDPSPINADNIIGTWDMVRADAVAYVDGYRIDGINVETEGTLLFEPGGKGVSDFTMSFEDSQSELVGDFTWERDGFELLIGFDGEEALRYANIKNEVNEQELQVTYEDEEGDEIEFTFIMARLR